MLEFRAIPASEAEEYVRSHTPTVKRGLSKHEVNSPGESSSRRKKDNPAKQDQIEIQDSLTLYLNEINHYPRLNINQEGILFAHIKDGKTIDDLLESHEFMSGIKEDERDKYDLAFYNSSSLEDLAFHTNLYLVVNISREFPPQFRQDLIQEGSLGLRRAVELHDPDLGALSSYAYMWIKGRMLSHLRDSSSPIKIPGSIRTLINKSRRITAEFEESNGRKPTDAEIQERLQLKPGVLNRAAGRASEIMRSGVMYPVSLDAKIFPDEDITLYDRIADVKISVEDEALRSVENEELMKRKRPSGREAAVAMGKSISTAQRALKRLVNAGILPLHPRDPRNVDASGCTEHTRNQDAMILALLQEDARLTKREIIEALAQPDKLGKRLSTLTIAGSISRLVKAGLISSRPNGRPGGISKDGRTIDELVEEFLQKDPEFRNKELVQLLSAPGLIGRKVTIRTVERARRRLTASGKKVRQIKRPQRSPDGITARVALQKYLAEHPDEPINRSAIGRQLGVGRERIRQLYDELTNG